MPIPIKLAIVGSRRFYDYDRLLYEMKLLYSQNYIVTQIISGGARGADSLAAKYAKENNIELIEHKPDWDKLGKRAGFARNEIIISSSDAVIAFWDGTSTGTKHSINLAIKYNKACRVCRYEDHLSADW